MNLNWKEAATVTSGLLLCVVMNRNDFNQAGTLLVDLFTCFLMQYLITSVTSENTSWRIPDDGIWCSLLCPYLLSILDYQDTFLARLFIPLTFLHYLWTRWKNLHQTTWNSVLVAYLIVRLYSIVQGPFFPLPDALSAMVYCGLLVIVPRCFKGSFTFGELTIVCQLLAYGCASLAKKCLHTGPSYIRHQMARFSSWSTITRWLSQEFFTKLNICLLAWWVALTVSSIVLVCYLGSEKSSSNTKTKRPNKIPRHSTTDAAISSNGSPSSATVVAKPKDKINFIQSANQQCNKSPHSMAAKPKGRVTQSASEDNKISDKLLNCTKDTDQLVHSIKDSDRPNNNQSISTKGKKRQVSTITRKYFHLMVLLVYIPGLVYNEDLLYLASWLAAAALVILEVARLCKLPPFGCILNQYLSVFLDKQDQGDLILTPLYLLLGCSLPLCILPTSKRGASIAAYSGLMSVGVGDGAASVIGKLFGQHKWPGSTKSIEGTIAAVFSQLVFVLVLGYLGVPGAKLSMLTLLCILLNSCLEAFTKQIDNLVIPLFTLVMLVSTDR